MKMEWNAYTDNEWLVLSHAVRMHMSDCVQSAWEKWRVKCICLQTSSVTVNHKKKMKRLLQNLFMSSTNFWTCPTRKRLRKSWSVRKMTELATNILDESDKFVFGPLVLLAPEWTVVKRALSRWNHRRLPRHTSTRTPRLCRWIAPWRWFR